MACAGARRAVTTHQDIRREAGNIPPGDHLQSAFLGAISGCGMVYGALFASGHLLLGNGVWAAVFVALTFASAILLRSAITRSWAN